MYYIPPTTKKTQESTKSSKRKFDSSAKFILPKEELGNYKTNIDSKKKKNGVVKKRFPS